MPRKTQRVTLPGGIDKVIALPSPRTRPPKMDLRKDPLDHAGDDADEAVTASETPSVTVEADSSTKTSYEQDIETGNGGRTEPVATSKNVVKPSVGQEIINRPREGTPYALSGGEVTEVFPSFGMARASKSHGHPLTYARRRSTAEPDSTPAESENTRDLVSGLLRMSTLLALLAEIGKDFVKEPTEEHSEEDRTRMREFLIQWLNDKPEPEQSDPPEKPQEESLNSSATLEKIETTDVTEDESQNEKKELVSQLSRSQVLVVDPDFLLDVLFPERARERRQIEDLGEGNNDDKSDDGGKPGKNKKKNRNRKSRKRAKKQEGESTPIQDPPDEEVQEAKGPSLLSETSEPETVKKEAGQPCSSNEDQDLLTGREGSPTLASESSRTEKVKEDAKQGAQESCPTEDLHKDEIGDRAQSYPPKSSKLRWKKGRAMQQPTKSRPPRGRHGLPDVEKQKEKIKQQSHEAHVTEDQQFWEEGRPLASSMPEKAEEKTSNEGQQSQRIEDQRNREGDRAQNSSSKSKSRKKNGRANQLTKSHPLRSRHEDIEKKKEKIEQQSHDADATEDQQLWKEGKALASSESEKGEEEKTNEGQQSQPIEDQRLREGDRAQSPPSKSSKPKKKKGRAKQQFTESHPPRGRHELPDIEKQKDKIEQESHEAHVTEDQPLLEEGRALAPSELEKEKEEITNEGQQSQPIEDQHLREGEGEHHEKHGEEIEKLPDIGNQKERIEQQSHDAHFTEDQKRWEGGRALASSKSEEGEEETTSVGQQFQPIKNQPIEDQPAEDQPIEDHCLREGGGENHKKDGRKNEELPDLEALKEIREQQSHEAHVTEDQHPWKEEKAPASSRSEKGAAKTTQERQEFQPTEDQRLQEEGSEIALASISESPNSKKWKGEAKKRSKDTVSTDHQRSEQHRKRASTLPSESRQKSENEISRSTEDEVHTENKRKDKRDVTANTRRKVHMNPLAKEFVPVFPGDTSAIANMGMTYDADSLNQPTYGLIGASQVSDSRGDQSTEYARFQAESVKGATTRTAQNNHPRNHPSQNNSPQNTSSRTTSSHITSPGTISPQIISSQITSSQPNPSSHPIQFAHHENFISKETTMSSIPNKRGVADASSDATQGYEHMDCDPIAQDQTKAADVVDDLAANMTSMSLKSDANQSQGDDPMQTPVETSSTMNPAQGTQGESASEGEQTISLPTFADLKNTCAWCSKRVYEDDPTTVLCNGCGPFSKTRYCNVQHLLNDLINHWPFCSNSLLYPIDNSTIPRHYSRFAPAIDNIHGNMNHYLFRQRAFSTYQHDEADYVIFYDYAQSQRAGRPVRTIVPFHKIKLQEGDSTKDAFNRVLNLCFLDNTLIRPVVYLYRLIRFFLRTANRWDDQMELELGSQIWSEFWVDVRRMTGETDSAQDLEKEWKGESGIKSIVVWHEQRHPLLRYWRREHPEVKKNWDRFYGVGFPGAEKVGLNGFSAGWNGFGGDTRPSRPRPTVFHYF